MVCDALLDQNIFTGVGNIIKNEVLFRTRIHPESKIGNIPQKKINELIKEARNYSFDFLEWKKQYAIKKTLAGTYQKNLPKMRYSACKKTFGENEQEKFFL